MLTKLILFPLLALGLGLGFLGDAPADRASAPEPTACIPDDCLPDCADGCEVVSVTPTPAGTCLVVCESPDGDRCEVELACDEPCAGEPGAKEQSACSGSVCPPARVACE